jgi:hypothetical protein
VRVVGMESAGRVNCCGSVAQATGELGDWVKPSYGIRSGYTTPGYHMGSV